MAASITIFMVISILRDMITSGAELMIPLAPLACYYYPLFPIIHHSFAVFCFCNISQVHNYFPTGTDMMVQLKRPLLCPCWLKGCAPHTASVCCPSAKLAFLRTYVKILVTCSLTDYHTEYTTVALIQMWINPTHWGNTEIHLDHILRCVLPAII